MTADETDNRRLLYEIPTSELVDELVYRMEAGIIYISVPHEHNLIKNHKIYVGDVNYFRSIRNDMIRQLDIMIDRSK